MARLLKPRLIFARRNRFWSRPHGHLFFSSPSFLSDHLLLCSWYAMKRQLPLSANPLFLQFSVHEFTVSLPCSKCVAAVTLVCLACLQCLGVYVFSHRHAAQPPRDSVWCFLGRPLAAACWHVDPGTDRSVPTRTLVRTGEATGRILS